jgi:hypothetical protein
VQETYESSDAGVGVATSAGGYRAVPSDTDTSAIDSDANAVLTDGGENESSGTGIDFMKLHFGRTIYLHRYILKYEMDNNNVLISSNNCRLIFIRLFIYEGYFLLH